MKYDRSKYSIQERIKVCLSKYVLPYQGKNVGKKVSRSLSNYKNVFDIRLYLWIFIL